MMIAIYPIEGEDGEAGRRDARAGHWQQGGGDRQPTALRASYYLSRRSPAKGTIIRRPTPPKQWHGEEVLAREFHLKRGWQPRIPSTLGKLLPRTWHSRRRVSEQSQRELFLHPTTARSRRCKIPPDSLPPRRVGPTSTGAERLGRFETESERVRHQLPEVGSQRTS